MNKQKISELLERVKALYPTEVKGVYKQPFKIDVQQALFETSIQIHSNSITRNHTINTVGEEIANIAIQLYPNVKIGDEYYPVLKFEDIKVNSKSFEDLADYGCIITIPLKGLNVRMSDLRIAEENLSKGKKSVTPDMPVHVGYNISNGEKELLDGYHRYLDSRGGNIENAKNNGSINKSIKAKIKFEIYEKQNGFLNIREATSNEISEAYYKAKSDNSNPELIRIIDESEILSEDGTYKDGGEINESELQEMRKIIRILNEMLLYKKVIAGSDKSLEDLFIDKVVSMIYEGTDFKSKRDIERVAEKEFGFNDKQKVRELTEYAILIVGRDISKAYPDIDEAYLKIVSLYSNQPYSTHRTNVSVALGQFSTPLPMAYLMGVYVGINKENKKQYIQPKVVSAKKVSEGQGYRMFKGVGKSSSQRYEVVFDDGETFSTYRASDRNEAVEQALIKHESDFHKYHGIEQKVYIEPCAGNGNLSLCGNPADFVVNELDKDRVNNLKKEGYAKVLNQDANMPFPFDYNHFDGMLANPPFAATKDKLVVDGYQMSGLEQQIIVKCLRYVKPEGKIAFIIGGHTEYDSAGRLKSAKEKAFLSYLFSHYHMDDVINVNGDLYGRQGTKYPIRIILLRGRKETVGGYYPLAKFDVDNLQEFSTKQINNFSELLVRMKKSLW